MFSKLFALLSNIQCCFLFQFCRIVDHFSSNQKCITGTLTLMLFFLFFFDVQPPQIENHCVNLFRRSINLMAKHSKWKVVEGRKGSIKWKKTATFLFLFIFFFVLLTGLDSIIVCDSLNRKKSIRKIGKKVANIILYIYVVVGGCVFEFSLWLSLFIRMTNFIDFFMTHNFFLVHVVVVFDSSSRLFINLYIKLSIRFGSLRIIWNATATTKRGVKIIILVVINRTLWFGPILTISLSAEQ